MSIAPENWEKIEAYFVDLREEAEEHAEQNQAAGYFFKKKDNFYGPMGTIFPAVMAAIIPMVAALTEDSEDKITLSDYLSSGTLALTAFCNGVNTWWKYGVRAQRHFDTELLFQGIASEIEVYLTKDSQFRSHPHEELVKMRLTMSKARHNEPPIPQWILKAYEAKKEV